MIHLILKKFIILFIVTAGFVINAKAQMPQDTTADSRLAKQIGINKDRAMQIRQAYNYKRKEIVSVMQDSKLKPQQKQQRLHQLMKERVARIAALNLTEQQKSALSQLQASGQQAMEIHRQQLRQQHDEQMRNSAVSVSQ